jgi:CubicO group peptidase (beta-lactamase class C family)
LLAILALPASAEAPDPQAGFDRAIRAEMQAGFSPGLQAAVVEGGALVWSGSYGVADIASAAPVTPATRFVLGSVSKLFTALAIVQLRDAGKLGLDDPVLRHLPWFTLQGEPHPSLTIRELLVHLAGLPRDALGASWNERRMPSRERLIADMGQEPVALPPETSWKYSNLGYAVLGLVVEAASGQTYAEYVTRHITEPLGMTRTVVEPGPGLHDLATGYGIPKGGKRAPREFLAMGAMLPAAGIASTASDMAKLLIWMLDDSDGKVLSPQSRREMLRAQAALPDGFGGQGLGFELRRVGTVIRIGKAGRAAGYTARIEADPALGLGIVVLANGDDAHPTVLEERGFTLFAAAIKAAAAAKPSPDPAWQRYIGTYVSTEGGESGIAIVDGRLAWVDPSAADPTKTAIPLDPAGPNRFRFTSGGLIGEIAEFETDAAGQVTGLLAGGTLDRRK